LSYKVESLKVLDPFDRDVGHYAVYGWWRLPPERAVNEWGDFVLDTEMCETYGIAFLVQRGTWFTPQEWEDLHPDYELARVALQAGTEG
jgi:hypothetical protein